MKTKLLFCISISLLIFFFYSCGNPNAVPDDILKEEATQAQVDDVTESEPLDDEEPIVHSEPIICNETKPKLDVYIAVLDVSKTIDAKLSGNMRVWIGDPSWVPSQKSDKERDSNYIPIATYAKITPIANAFDIEPKEYVCLKIEPIGSSVNFTLIPKKAKWGKMDVSALIELYQGDYCEGTPVPIAAEVLTVKVKINFLTLCAELFEIFWDKFLIFFGTVLGIISTYYIIKIRKKAKLDDKDEE